MARRPTHPEQLEEQALGRNLAAAFIATRLGIGLDYAEAARPRAGRGVLALRGAHGDRPDGAAGRAAGAGRAEQDTVRGSTGYDGLGYSQTWEFARTKGQNGLALPYPRPRPG